MPLAAEHEGHVDAVSISILAGHGISVGKKGESHPQLQQAWYDRGDF